MQPRHDSFRMYFEEPAFQDRYLREPERAVDVIIPIIHTNELWRSNLLAAYREMPINRILLGNGGCIDDSLTIASEFPRIQVFDHTQYRSLGFSLRRLMEAVETDWFVYIHSDVYLPNGWFDTMSKEQANYEWFECEQFTTVFLRQSPEYTKLKRAFSGGQMGKKAAFAKVLPVIDDDYLYRNEDIIFAKLIEKSGFRYGKVDSTYIDHQQRVKDGPWLRRVKKLIFEMELGRDEELRTLETFVKGIVRYLTPESAEDVIPSVRSHLDRLLELDAISPPEFERWVAETNPKWSGVLLPSRPGKGNASTLGRGGNTVTYRRVPIPWKKRSFGYRLRRAPSALLRRLSRASERAATWLTPR